MLISNMAKSTTFHSGQALSRYSVETARSDQALCGLKHEWNRLSCSTVSTNAFMTYAWYEAWLRQLNSTNPEVGRAPYVLAIRRGGSLMGILPLIRRVASRMIRVRILEFVSIHSDYNDFVLGEDSHELSKVAAEFLAQSSQEWDVLNLRDLRCAEAELELLEGALTEAGLSYLVVPEEERCPFFAIEGDSAVTIKRLSGDARRTLRNRSVRASEQGLTSRIIENPEREPRLLEKLIALEQKKSLRRISQPFVGSFPNVFQTLFDELGPGGWLYVALLERSDTALAFQIGFRSGNKLWDYSKAYDDSVAHLGPGALLLQAILDYGDARGFREYDFLRGEEPYKLVWSTGLHRRFRLMIWNRRKISQLKKFIYHDMKIALRRSNRVSAESVGSK